MMTSEGRLKNIYLHYITWFTKQITPSIKLSREDFVKPYAFLLWKPLILSYNAKTSIIEFTNYLFRLPMETWLLYAKDEGSNVRRGKSDKRG